MRRTVAVLAALTIVAGLMGIMPAHASHDCIEPSDTNPACGPATIIMFEGLGKVCTGADKQFTSDPKPRCTYKSDRFWSTTDKYKDQYDIADFNRLTPSGCTWGTSGCSLAYPQLQGLYLPKAGPSALSPFSFIAGPATDPGKSFCAGTVGGSGCTFKSYGRLYTGETADVGAYCGSSKGEGNAVFTSVPVNGVVLTTKTSFGWEQSAGSILPLSGSITDTTPNGGEGGAIQGFATSRGFVTPSNELGCGVQVPVTGFQTEGMVVAY